MKQTKNKKQSLKGYKFVLTRTKNQSQSLKERIQSLGAEVIELPLIRIEPYCNPDTIEEVFSELGTYEFIVFTSVNGVKHFFEFFFKKFKDLRCIGGCRIACIGTATAEEVNKYHLQVDVVPETALSENLAESMIAFQSLENLKVLVVTGSLNSPILPNKLMEARAIVDTLQVYETKEENLSKNPQAALFREKGADAVIFTSASTVASFINQAENLKLSSQAKVPLICSIGPKTSETIRKLGLIPHMEAKEHSLEGIIEALIDKFQ